MNPTVPQSVIDRAMERDPDSASAEYGAEFRQDISGFMTRDAIEAVVTPGCIERPYETGKLYSAFVDPSGGSRDLFTLAIGHMDKKTEVAVLDVLRDRRPPFSPEAVVDDFATTLKAYNVTKVLAATDTWMNSRANCSASGASLTNWPTCRSRTSIVRSFLR